MFNYERDYSEENGLQRSEQRIEPAPVISRINSELFCGRKALELVIEALLFAIIVAISVWPVFAAVDALNDFLQRTASCGCARHVLAGRWRDGALVMNIPRFYSCRGGVPISANAVAALATANAAPIAMTTLKPDTKDSLIARPISCRVAET
jgi:hypothetical protein